MFKTEERLNALEGGACPAIVVLRGLCLLLDSEITYSLGAGVLSTYGVSPGVPEEGSQLPMAYLENCKISSCGFSGVEVRQYGEAIVKDCQISGCGKGMMIWSFPSKVLIQNSKIYNNLYEGIHTTSESQNYDSNIDLEVFNSEIHHNQLGLSLEFSGKINVQKSVIHNNRSWAVALRNSVVAFFGENELFRNECGGFKVMLNRFNQTVFMRNKIHHHTGPDIVQTRYYSEAQEVFVRGIGSPLLDPELNSVKIITLDNLSFNNDLHYENMSDIEVLSESLCNFCHAKKIKLKCQNCLFTSYCSQRCLREHRKKHEDFCLFFKENKIIKVTLIREDFTPANDSIEDHTKKMSLGDETYEDEVLIKITGGYDYYGFKKR